MLLRHHHLGERQALRGPRGGLLRAQRARRRSTARAARAARSEPRVRRSWCRKRETKTGVSGGGARTKASSAASRAALPPLAGGLDPRRPLVRLLHLVQPLHRAQRHAPHALDQRQAEHGRHGPELADGERRDLLEGRDEVLDVLEVDPPLGVRDQGDRQLVDARVAGERPARQLGQLAVVAARQALAHLADVLLHHVVVVEQPLARRPDVHVAVGSRREAVVGVVQDAPGLREAGQQGSLPAPPHRRGQALRAGDGAGLLGELVGAQQLAPDGAREELVPPRAGAGGKGGAEAERGYRGRVIGQILPSTGAGAARWNFARGGAAA